MRQPLRLLTLLLSGLTASTIAAPGSRAHAADHHGLAAQTASDAPEATSLLGAPLRPSPPTGDALTRLNENLAAADAAYRANPSADALIWLGRRTAYLGRYREAIAIFSKGVTQFPDDARFYRHRGHRYITIRRFDAAVADFTRAAALVEGRPDEVEPDGQPNARNIPTSTLQFNIWYHLGLAEYLQGNFDRARAAYERCLAVSKNSDAQVATRHWLYMTLRRLGDARADAVLAPVTASMDVIENASYHRLLLLYRGQLTPEALLQQSAAALDRTTVTYGLGNWHFYNGRRAEAVALWKTNVHGTQWAAFGSIAAEAELARLGEKP